MFIREYCVFLSPTNGINVGMKKTILIIQVVILCVLSGYYFLDPNRRATQEVLLTKGAQTGRDYMVSSLNVTTFARDKRELVWIGTSAGINVYDGKDFVQFFHDTKDSTALPDDYINVLHLDKAGRMWVGTQNGLARYVGAYRFHRVALPSNAASGNIVAIENAKPSDIVGKDAKEIAKKAVLVSNGKQTFLIKDNDQVSLSHRQIQPNPLQAKLPDDDLILKKPRELVTATFRDLGDNLWVGYRNAGYQVISQNRIAFLYANHNPLAEATKGKDIVCMGRVGHHILAGSTLRLFIYDTQDRNLGETYYHKIFDLGDGIMPAPKLALDNIVPFDDERAWLVGNHHVLSCYIDHEKPEIVGKASFGKGVQLGFATKVGKELYVSSQSQYLLRFPFGAAHPDSIVVPSRWYDEETQLATLHNGDVFLFMKNMHFAIYSPKTGKVTALEGIANIPDYSNIDPAFVHEDSYGNIWLGTKRYGLYHLNIAEHHVTRIHVPNDVHIQALVEDNQGQIWVTTMRDAFCLQPKTRLMVKNSLVSSRQNQNNWQFFDNAICLSPNGDVVFGSSDGCKFLPPPAMNSNFLSTYAGQHAGRVLGIYSLEVQSDKGKTYAIGETVADGSRYTFTYDENHVKFGFFYPNYSRRSALMYQYMLEGVDNDWRTPTYDHEAQFADLSSGKYTFRLRLITSPDQPPLQERKVEFVIQTAPWWSAAAWFLYVCIIGWLIYYVNSLYLKARTNRMLMLQEHQEKEREKRANEMNMNFFANVSHEFRNPITIIAGPLLALQSDSSLPASVHQTLNRVCMSVNRMLRLIDQMLDFNQLETDVLRLKVSQVDAADELRKQASTFEESTKVKGIKLELVLDENTDYHVWIDKDKLEKILSNLFTNALKHTSSGGIIRITAKKGRNLEISVFNSGAHLDEEKMQNVFKRYYQLADKQTTHRYGWGTGIGLYYVKRLVELHHGEITVRNVVAKEEENHSSENTSQDVPMDGVEFRFSLPADEAIYNKVEKTAQEKTVMQIPLEGKREEGRKKNEEETTNNFSLEESVRSVESVCVSSSAHPSPKILIVDDDIDVAQYIRSIFCNDYQVENRYSAEEALADLDKIRPDIILSDIIMGEMSGYEFCKTLKGNLMYSHIPVVLITAKSNMDEQVQGLRLGAVAYITKPFDPTYLKALVESQLQNMKTLQKRLGESTDTEDLSAQEADTLSAQDRKFMDELYALMEKRAAEMELNVATICHDLLISQSKFNYKLKELTGETPGSFFRRYKLNKAAQLLREGQYNVSEIAVMTGFSTAAHFSVAFKKQFGVSPSEYPGRVT